MMRDIRYSSRFQNRYAVLELRTKNRVKKALALFVDNPLHPSLRLHKHSGTLDRYWSILVDRKYRVIIEMEKEFVVLVSIGTHAIYEKL